MLSSSASAELFSSPTILITLFILVRDSSDSTVLFVPGTMSRSSITEGSYLTVPRYIELASVDFALKGGYGGVKSSSFAHKSVIFQVSIVGRVG